MKAPSESSKSVKTKSNELLSWLILDFGTPMKTPMNNENTNNHYLTSFFQKKVDQILGQKEFCCQFMSQSQSSTLYENDSYLTESMNSGSVLLNERSNPIRGRASQVSNQNSLYLGRKNTSMIQHVVQSSPQHFSISNKLNESFEDNSTQHRNSSFSNSNGGGSFISRSGNGRILSDQNLSPLCNKLSDLSNGGFSNSFNYGNRQMNTSTSSYSSLNDNTEMSNSLLLAKEYLEKDESLIDSNIFELLIEDLHSLNSNSIKEYYNKIIASFQNDDEYSQFFNENQFIEDYQLSNKKQINLQSNSSICTNQNSLNDVSSTSPISDALDFQTFESIQEFENSQQNLKVGSAMSSLIFQINPQKHFRNTMILTFDYFMTPLTFLLYVIKCYYIPKPIGLSEKEEEKFEKRIEQIRINIGQVIRDYVEIRSSEFLQSNITSVLLIVFFQTIPSNSKEKSLFTQLAEKVKEKKTQYELQNIQKNKKQPSNSSSYCSNSSQTFPSSNIYQRLNPQNTSFSAPNNLINITQNNSSITNEELMRKEKKNKQIQRHLQLYELSPLLHYQTDTIAKVLAQIDAKWFVRLNISNLINSKASLCSKSSYVKKYSNRFNYYVYWFKNQVISQKQIDNRVSQIIQYIDIMMKLDQEYHSYPTVHALFTVISYLQNQLPITWKYLEEKLRKQQKWVTITVELQQYQKMFNDKYYGYKQKIIKLQEIRQSYIPCMNPYLQDIYNDEMKFTAVSAKKNSSGNQLVVPRVIHERIGDRLLNLSILQKQCEKIFPLQDIDYKDFRNSRTDESQLYAIFKKKCVKEIDDLLLQNGKQFKDLEIYFIQKCKELEPNN